MQRTNLLLALLAAATLAAAAQTSYTRRSTNYIREGPGAYYPLVAAVPENTAVTVGARSGNWVKVQLPGQKAGWLAANSLSAQKNRSLPVQNLSAAVASPKASTAGVSAAIKGFAASYAPSDSSDVDALAAASQKHFTAADLREFTGPLPASRTQRPDAELRDLGYDAALDEVKIGTGVAARLAGLRLVEDQGVQRYVNLVGAALAAASPLYNWDFTVLVLDDSVVSAVGAPGGYILLTRGAVTACTDEAELAALIAHEMARVSKRRGFEEVSERLTLPPADEAFRELDEEVEKMEREKQELEDLAAQTYDGLSRPRSLTHEREADRTAIALCLAAGYDAAGVVRLLERLQTALADNADSVDPDYATAGAVAERLRYARTALDKATRGKGPGARLTSRFADRTRTLR